MSLTNLETDFYRGLIKESAKKNPEDVRKFILSHPDAKDAFAYLREHEKAFGEMYDLAHRFVKYLNEGKAFEKGFTKKDADPEQLAMGMKVEAEHSSDPEIKEHTALDHLSEAQEWKDKKYYTGLNKMEEGQK